MGSEKFMRNTGKMNCMFNSTSFISPVYTVNLGGIR
jgi:hypothetical protein